MTDETLAPELEETQGSQPQDETANLQEPEAPDAPEQPEDDGLDDLEWEGVKARVPRDLKPVLSERLGKFSEHFTKTSQSNSAKAKELEAREQRISEAAKVSKEEMKLHVDLNNVEGQLEQYGQQTADWWQKLKEENYNAWTEHRFHIQALRDAKRELGTKIEQADTKRTQDAKMHASQRIEAADEYAAKNLKGWNPDTAKKVIDFAAEMAMKNHKLSAEEAGTTITSNMSPFMLELMYLANIGSETLKAAPKAAVPSPAVAPLEVVGGKRNPGTRVNLEDPNLSMDDYVRVRQQQIKAKGR